MPVDTRTIGQLPPRTLLLSTDLLEIQADDGLSYNIDVQQLSNFVGSLSFFTTNNVFTGTNQFNNNIGFFGNIPVSQAAALAVADDSILNPVYGATEIAVINNMRTRINELESILQVYGLLP